MRGIRGCMAGGTPEAMALWNRICDEQESEERRWIAELRAQGFKAAHPNDGWVDRERNIVTFCYPHFDDGAQVGDLVMLGWASSNPATRYLRPIRLTGLAPNRFNATTKRFTFEDAARHKEPAREI